MNTNAYRCGQGNQSTEATAFVQAILTAVPMAVYLHTLRLNDPDGYHDHRLNFISTQTCEMEGSLQALRLLDERVWSGMSVADAAEQLLNDKGLLTADLKIRLAIFGTEPQQRSQ